MKLSSYLTGVFFLLTIFLMLPNFAAAYTVRVITINPDVHIPGGSYASPFIITTGNTKYILDADIFADSSGIMLNGNLSNIIIDLNGHTITYNQVSPGVGIGSLDWSTSDVAIINGSIVQGFAMSDGVVYGTGSNPIRFYAGTPQSYNVFRVQIAGVSVRYGSKDVGGIILGADGHLIEDNIIEDTYEYGIVTDRHVGIPAIRTVGQDSIIKNNTLTNVRQRGIDLGQDSEAFGNNVSIRSICTNSVGISTDSHGVKIYDNIINGRGEHPIGIGAHNSTLNASYDNEIYNNTIDVQTTRIGLEYFGAYPSDALTAVHIADRAVGIRSTSGAYNLKVHDNVISAASDSDFMGTYSPDGRAIRISGGARGVMAGVRYNEQSARFYNNTITVLDKDGTGYAAGFACDANIDNNNEPAPNFRPPAVDFAPSFIVENNVITSNVYNFIFGDDYQSCNGDALFIGNTLIKSNSYASYATYGVGLGGYYGNKVRVIGSVYQSGAAENSLDFYWSNVTNLIEGVGGSYRGKSITFGDLQLDNHLYYRYKLHNVEGTTGSATPINSTLNAIGPLFYFQADVVAPSAPVGLEIL
ncbi:MAG: hypothetical protein HGA36_02935 [Candidatus Moranbacteria bacterium]|nr:hypothetical protein [Candidatus Moranbacteria bacterium]